MNELWNVKRRDAVLGSQIFAHARGNPLDVAFAFAKACKGRVILSSLHVIDVHPRMYSDIETTLEVNAMTRQELMDLGKDSGYRISPGPHYQSITLRAGANALEELGAKHAIILAEARQKLTPEEIEIVKEYASNL